MACAVRVRLFSFQIRFVVGDTSTEEGALRASLGRSEPFTLNYVEIGNEVSCDSLCLTRVPSDAQIRISSAIMPQTRRHTLQLFIVEDLITYAATRTAGPRFITL